MRRARQIVECSWALLKNRFQCLKNTLRLKKPENCGQVIMACGHLHNFIIDTKETEDDFAEFMGIEQENEEVPAAADGGNPNQIFQNPNLRKVYETFIAINNIH